ncbi:MAG: transporter, partial [Cyclobacteriaceae bacterium]
MIKKLFKYFILFFCGSLFSQDTTLLTNTLSLDQLYGIVLQYHPVAKQAEILIKKGKQQLRASRGAFDPKFYSSFSEKEFKGKDYYNLAETGLKIPTWYGI